MNIKKVIVNGLTIEGFDQDYIFQTIENAKDFYESVILNLWTPRLGNPQVIFDIGANIGNHTLFWELKLSPKKIYSFEPYSPNFARLQNNIRNNSLATVVPVNLGVGDHKGFANIKKFDENNFGSIELQYANNEDLDKSEIKLIDIDSFVSEEKIDYVDFIKIDVEGFELSVLDGMRNLIVRDHPDLWIEVTENTCVQIMERLLVEGYKAVDVEAANILFLHESRHKGIVSYDSQKVLQLMFLYLSKTNAYYKNYLTAKDWLAGANKKLDLEKKRFTECAEDITRLGEEKKALEQRNSEHAERITRLEKEKKALEQRNSEYAERVTRLEEEKKALEQQNLEFAILIEDLVVQNDQSVGVLLKAQKEIQRLKIQNGHLNRENLEYRRKLSKITDTWYGRIGIICYKILKKIKNKLIKK